MRVAFAESLYREAKRNERIHVVVADISPVGSMQKFRNEFPDRFHNVGVAEAAMIGIAAGLALKGKIVFCYSIATFSLYRCFEFVRNDLCYQQLPVVVVGMGAGLSYADHGSTHHAIEDVAIASAIPNMQVIAPCDPFETERAVEWCCRENKGPVYLRLGKSGEPILTPHEPWFFGMPRVVYQHGNHAAILSYGPITKLARDVAMKIGNSEVLSVHTLKPLASQYISKVLDHFSKVIVVEEHVPHGGLSSRVKEIVCDKHRLQTRALHCFTLKDEFVHCNGKRDEMLAAHGLSLDQICKQLGL